MKTIFSSITSLWENCENKSEFDPDLNIEVAIKNLGELSSFAYEFFTDSQITIIADGLERILYNNSYPNYLCEICGTRLVADYDEKILGPKLHCPQYSKHPDHKWFAQKCTIDTWYEVKLAEAKRHLALAVFCVFVIDNSTFFNQTSHTIESLRLWTALSDVRKSHLKSIYSSYFPVSIFAKDEIEDRINTDLESTKRLLQNLGETNFRESTSEKPLCNICGMAAGNFSGPNVEYSSVGDELGVVVSIGCGCHNNHTWFKEIAHRTYPVDTSQFGCSCSNANQMAMFVEENNKIRISVSCRCEKCGVMEEIDIHGINAILDPLLFRDKTFGTNVYDFVTLNYCTSYLFQCLQKIAITSDGLFFIIDTPYPWLS